MRCTTAARRVADGCGPAIAFAAAALALAAASATSARAQSTTPALRVAIDRVLAGEAQSLELVLLLDPRLGGGGASAERRRRAVAGEFDDLLARARPGALGLDVDSRGDAAGLGPLIVSNVHLHRWLAPFFARHSFDCNQRVVLHLEAARRLGLVPPAYARALDHAGLIFEDYGLVLDPYDRKLRTLLDFARGRGLSSRRGEGYFLRTPTHHYLVAADPAGGLRPLSIAERPDLVAPYEPFASLLLDAAAVSSSPATARAHAELALALDPTNADAHDTLGNVAADIDPAAAAAEYATALEIDPHPHACTTTWRSFFTREASSRRRKGSTAPRSRCSRPCSPPT